MSALITANILEIEYTNRAAALLDLVEDNYDASANRGDSREKRERDKRDTTDREDSSSENPLLSRCFLRQTFHSA